MKEASTLENEKDDLHSRRIKSNNRIKIIKKIIKQEISFLNLYLEYLVFILSLILLNAFYIILIPTA